MYGIVVGGSLNRRASASKSATALGSYSDGSYITIERYNDEWYKTSFVYNNNTTTGYVQKAYVARVGDTVKVRKNSVNVRNAANGSTVLYSASINTTSTVIAIEKSGNYGWIQGNFGSGVGWIRGDMFNKTSSNNNDSGFDQGGYELGTIFNGRVIGENVNLRYGPSASYGVRDSLDYLSNIEIRVIKSGGTSEQRESWLWCKQRTNNRGEGYAYARYLYIPYTTKYGSTPEFPVRKVSGDNVNIRVRPSTSADSFGKLSKNEDVAIIDSSRTGWYRVGSSLGIGWVSSSYID